MKIRNVMMGAFFLMGVSVVWAAGAVEKGTVPAPPAAKWKGSIPVTGTHTEGELVKLAKISSSDAEKVALKIVGGEEGASEIFACELEVEDGYLVYSVEVKVGGEEGVEELLIDAGSGKVLLREHESDEGEEEGEGDDVEEGQQGEDHDDGHED